MADEASRIERRRRFVECGEIVGEALVMVIGGVADQIERRRRSAVEHQRGEAHPAISGHDGGDALARLGRHIRGREQCPVVMGMHIDKARGDDLARNVELQRARHLADDTDRGDTVAGDRDVGPAARPAAAVDHLTAPQNPIGHAHLLCFARNDTKGASSLRGA
jgi:hypothetical protein